MDARTSPDSASQPPVYPEFVVNLFGKIGLTPSRNLFLLAGTAFFMAFGMAAQNAVGNNFQVETLQMTASDRGLMEGGREVPGLLLIFISAATYALPPQILAAVSILTMVVQYFGYSLASSVWHLIGLTMFGSIGFHLWAPLQREMNMSLGTKSQSGRMLGFMAGVGSAGGLAGMVSVYLFATSLGYRTMFLWAAISLVFASLLVWRVTAIRKQGEERSARFVIRREYGFYYLLTMLEGSARQIWGSFAMFTIVSTFQVDVRTVTMMLIVNSILTMIMNPRIGIWIDQWGERKALMVGYTGLIIVFLAFALNTVSWVAIAIFFTYASMFAFTQLATPSYIHKIARPGELSPSLAMGITCEHIVGVFIPVVGGFLWVTYGYTYAFLIGTAISVICFLVVTRLPKGQLIARADAVAEPVGH